MDRKALKRDPLTQLVQRGEALARANMNLVLGVLAGIVAVVVLGSLWKKDSVRRSAESDQTLSQAVMLYTNGQFDQAIELSNTMQSSSPDSRGAVAGLYVTGACQLRLGRFADAEKSLRDSLDRSAKMPLYDHAARAALAAALAAQERHSDAASAYQELAGRLQGPAAAQAQLDAARELRAAGSVGEAKALLEKLSIEATPVAREAKLELAVLEGLSAGRP
jgi:tetratricopeptide (TPR) repeat protein